MGLPRVKKAGDSSYERRKYDKHQRRLLSNELRDLDAIKTRQEKYMARDQMEIKRELWKLTEEKRRHHYHQQKLAREKAIEEAKQAASNSVGKELRQYMSGPLGLASLANNANVILSPQKQTYSLTSQEAIRHPQTLHPLPAESQSIPKSPLTRVKRPNILPKLERQNSVLSSHSLSTSASMVSLMSSNAIAQKGRKPSILAALSELSVSQEETSNEESIAKVEKANQTPTEDASSAQSSAYSSSTGGELELEGREDSHLSLREKTQQKLKKFLCEQGIDIEQTPSLALLTNEIIALRNLGKSTDEVWDDVRNCRYLRGYEPPIMVIPRDDAGFVFGQSASDVYQQHLQRIAETVQRAKNKSRTEVLLPQQRPLPQRPTSVKAMRTSKLA